MSGGIDRLPYALAGSAVRDLRRWGIRPYRRLSIAQRHHRHVHRSNLEEHHQSVERAERIMVE